MPTYTKANLYTDIQRDASDVANIDRLANRAARYVVGDIDLRSTKRRAYFSPVIAQDQHDYQAPSDLKEFAVIDIRKLAERTARFRLVPSEEFDALKSKNKNLICIEDRDFLKKLRISAELEGDQLVVHDMNSITADGTWSLVLDASNLTLDTDNFIHGEGSLNFDMDIGGTTSTAGAIVNSTMGVVDLSDYEVGGSIYIYLYAPTITGLDGFTLRIGSDASNYFSKQVTVTNENLAFHTGWMLLRFDFSAMTETGTVDMDNIDYIRFSIDKGSDSLNSTDWRIDYIVARRGAPHEIWYYTKYPWQNTSGTYLENSTATTDLLNADTEEYELFILKGKEIVADDLKMFDDAKEYRKQYEAKKMDYLMKYPSERLVLTTEYYNFASLESGNINDDD